MRGHRYCHRCRRAILTPEQRNAEKRRQCAERVERGLVVLRAGGTYAEAQRAAGYADASGFSRACMSAFGVRPRMAAALMDGGLTERGREALGQLNALA